MTHCIDDDSAGLQLRGEGGSELFWVGFSKITYCIGLEIPLETSGQPAREKRYSRKYDPPNIANRYIKNVPYYKYMGQIAQIRV